MVQLTARKQSRPFGFTHTTYTVNGFQPDWDVTCVLACVWAVWETVL